MGPCSCFSFPFAHLLVVRFIVCNLLFNVLVLFASAALRCSSRLCPELLVPFPALEQSPGCNRSLPAADLAPGVLVSTSSAPTRCCQQKVKLNHSPLVLWPPNYRVSAFLIFHRRAAAASLYSFSLPLFVLHWSPLCSGVALGSVLPEVWSCLCCLG